MPSNWTRPLIMRAARSTISPSRRGPNTLTARGNGLLACIVAGCEVKGGITQTGHGRTGHTRRGGRGCGRFARTGGRTGQGSRRFRTSGCGRSSPTLTRTSPSTASCSSATVSGRDTSGASPTSAEYRSSPSATCAPHLWVRPWRAPMTRRGCSPPGPAALPANRSRCGGPGSSRGFRTCSSCGRSASSAS